MSINKLKLLFAKQFGKDFPFNEEGLKYETTGPMRKEDVLSLLKFRYEHGMTTIVNDPQHQLLIDNLDKYNGLNVVLHLIGTSQGMHLYITDDAMEVIVGWVLSPLGRNNVK